MAESFSYYKKIADRMVDADRQRDQAFAYYQKMRRNDWKIPDGAEQIPGIRKVIDTSPSDAVAKAVQVMAARPPKLKMMPAINNPEGRQRANMIERILKWNQTNADRFRSRGVVADAFESAALYDAVAMNIVDLEHQMKNVDDATRKKLQRIRRYTRFIVNTFNPRDVHVRRSAYGVECVLLCQERPAHEVIAEYPMSTKMLKEMAENDSTVLFHHYMDYEASAIWVSGDGINDQPIINPTNHDMPFMYWIAMMGGTSLDDRPEHQYRPILYPIWTSDEWETKNMIDTLMTSDVIWKALAPVIAVEGPGADRVTYDTGNPSERVIPVPYGSVKPLPPQQVDPGLFTISQDFKGRMMDSTVSTLLGGADIPSGTSFAALNLQTQTALGALKPAKELTERALAEMFTLMLLWTSYTDEPLNAYNDQRRSEQYGEEYTIEPDEIDEENIYITVELDPDEPTDKLQRANTATLLMQLGYPKKYALEDMGVEDPEKAMDEYFEEQMDDHQLQMFLQGDMMDMQAQQQQQMEAQQIAQQQDLAGAIPGGQGFNPAMGGEPPAAAFPGATREGGQGLLGMEGL